MKDLNEIKFEPKKRSQAGMTVPEGFFEQFQQQLEAKIDTLEAVKNPSVGTVQPKNDYRIFRWSIAASVAFLIGIGVYAFYSNDSADMPSQEELAQSESLEEECSVEDMVMRSVNDFELYDLYCEL